VAIVQTAHGSNKVPLGLPALSVSILNPKSTEGETNFLRESLSVLAASQLPKAAKDTLVLAVTSPIFCTV